MAFSVESLKKLYSDLDNREIRWDEACEVCELLKFVHTGNMICRKIPDLQIDAAWNGFRMLMELVRNWHRESKEKMQMESNFTQELK